MKVAFCRVVYIIGLIAASCIGGWYLGALISRSPFWMPEWLFKAIAAVVKLSGVRGLYNEDDIETIALTCLLLVCWVIVAILLCIVSISVARGLKKRR